MVEALGEPPGHRRRRRRFRVVVLRGEGPKAFCVGADITRFEGLTPVQMLAWTGLGHQVFDALAALRQPTVAVVHSPAFGGGLELALACDLRVAAATTRLGLPEVGLGTVPGWGGTERLTELVGRARAKDIVLARRTVDGPTAEAWGLVNTCVSVEDLDPAVDDLVSRLAAGAPVAVTLAKQAHRRRRGRSTRSHLERFAGAVTSATEDLATGIAAFRTSAPAAVRRTLTTGVTVTLTDIAISDNRLILDGQEVDSVSGETFERTSPAHDVVVARYAKGGADDVARAVTAARRAFDAGPWPRRAGVERSRVLRRVADLIRRDRDELARIETLESGKPITQANDEVDASAELWYYAATLAQHAYGDAHNDLGPNVAGDDRQRNRVGVVAMITPWNFPLLIVSQKLPFALAVGCTAVVKPSELTPGTTIRLVQILHEAGCRQRRRQRRHRQRRRGLGDGATIRHVDMITFTGSTGVGTYGRRPPAERPEEGRARTRRQEPAGDLRRRRPRRRADAVVFGVYFNQGECCNAGSRAPGARRHRRRVHRTRREARPAGPGRRSARRRHQGRRHLRDSTSAVISGYVSRGPGAAPRSCSWAAAASTPTPGGSTTRPCSPASGPHRSLARRSSARCCRC